MSAVAARARLLAGQPWYLAALAVVFMTLAVVAARPAAAESGSLNASSSPSRSGATALSGSALSGAAHVFLTTGEDVQRVVFSLDGAEVRLENFAPWDFQGTDSGNATPWATTATGDGSHTISAQVFLVGGGDFTVSASFTVQNAAPPASTASGTLLVSQSANRGGASALDGSTLTGEVYPFAQISGQVARVDFSLDGASHRQENLAPFDFNGSSSGDNAASANAWATTSIADGVHSISALVTLTDNSEFAITVSFTVSNGGSDGEATSTPTATPEAPTGALLVSGSSNRSDASALGAAALNDDVFVFFTSSSQLSEVRFKLDGTFVRTEKLTPFDFAGTQQGGTASKWDTVGVADGAHVIEATAVTTDGVSFSVSSSFVVDNDPLEDGDSEVGSTSEDSTTDRSVALFVSQSPSRNGALTLGGDALTGEVYIFAVPNEAPDRVRFYVDPDQQPLPLRTESLSPYDLGGTAAGGDARSFDINGLDEGEHTLLVVAEYADGESASLQVRFTVEYPEVLPELEYELLVSSSASRSGAMSLDEADLDELAYIFVSSAEYIDEAVFYLDDPARSTADRIDGSAPFDLIGGGTDAAQPLDVAELTAGAHSLTVVLTRTDGTTVEAHATFSVGGATLPNGAILIETSDNAAQTAGQHAAGTTFVFEAGVHRGVSISPQSGDVFLGSPGAILSGATVLSSWNAGSGYWYVNGQTSELTGSGGCGYNEDGSRYDACKYPE